MGISNRLSNELESIFNKWSRIRITDEKLKQLIQLAMVPNKEILTNIKSGNLDELSTAFKNVCDNVYEYTQSRHHNKRQQRMERFSVHIMLLPVTFKM